MKRRVLISTLALATGLSAAGFLACGVEDEIDEEAALRDAELDEDEDARDEAIAMVRPTAIGVGVAQIRLHHREAGWMQFETREVFDLMTPVQVQKYLNTLKLKAGAYDEIRLVVKYGFVAFGRAWYDLEIPSSAKAGLTIDVDFCVTRAGVEMPTTWNVEKYLHRTDPRGFWLEPTIAVRSTGKCPTATR